VKILLDECLDRRLAKDLQAFAQKIIEILPILKKGEAVFIY